MENNWVVIGASEIGKSHKDSETPCQDHFVAGAIDKNWSFIVVCDGAGSKPFSKKGAFFVSNFLANQLKKDLEINSIINSDLPNNLQWRESCINLFRKACEGLKPICFEEDCDLEDLSCTVILMLFSKIGILIGHIGDGRAAYLGEGKSWKSAMTPFTGIEVGTTIFITDDIWGSTDTIETRVIPGPISGVSVLTDGFEKACFEYYTWNETKGAYFDPNNPYDKFFNFNFEIMKESLIEGSSKEEISFQWKKFLAEGNELIREENDDKTCVWGIYWEGE